MPLRSACVALSAVALYSAASEPQPEHDCPWLYSLLRCDFAMVAEIVEVGRPPYDWRAWGMSAQKVKYRVLRVPWGEAPGDTVEVSHRLDFSGGDVSPARARLLRTRFRPGRRVIVFASGRYEHAVGRWPRELPPAPAGYTACQPETGTPAADVESVRELYRAIAEWRARIRGLCQAAELVFLGRPDEGFLSSGASHSPLTVQYEVKEVLKGRYTEGTVQVSHVLPSRDWSQLPRPRTPDFYVEVSLYFPDALVFAVRSEEGEPEWRDVSGEYRALAARPVNVAEVRQTLLLLPRGAPEE